MNTSCDLPSANHAAPHARFPDPAEDLPPSEGLQSLILAGGCFWCVEAVFRQLEGVESVASGYAGGDAATANYDAVCSGRTLHAEAVKLDYDPSRISFGRLLKVFFSTAHDPTQLDRQGNDRGRQYRSAIFYADDAQKRIATDYIRALDAAGVFRSPIVTKLESLRQFFPGETYHQNYAARNPGQPYIAGVSMPKVEKTREYFSDSLRTQAPR